MTASARVIPICGDISSLALDVRSKAALVVDRHINPSQKQASLALYAVLASCKEICERCEYDPAERAELERLFLDQPREGNRRYVERGSDIYVLVCRFVFTETDRSNAMRYAAALREADKMRIRSSELARWMKDHGGVNALYFRRPLHARYVKTKALRLAEQIQFCRDRPFTVTLRWRDDNTFEVVTMEQGR